MRTFSFVTIFSIEKCSVRLGAFGAKLRRVESSGSRSDRIRIGTHNNYNPPENCKILCVFQRKITRSDVFFVWGVLQDLFLCIFLPLWPLIILAGRLVKNTHKSVCICFRQKPSKAQQWLEWESEWIHHLYNTDSNTNTQIRKYANTNTQIQIQIQYDS